MSDLLKIKQDLRDALPKKGISFLLKSLKGLLPGGTPKYDILLTLEAEYRQLKLDTFAGVLSHENKILRESQLRKRLLDLISSLVAEDFDKETEHSALADKQKIRRGHVLYRIPQQMQLQEESRCLVRIAFDKAMIVEDLDLDEDIELRSEVRISDYMKVEIEDPSAEGVFAIRTTSEEVQFIDQDDFTEWHFYVKPLVPGEHSLELKVSVILRINGEDRIREKTLEESVVVINEAPKESPETTTFSELEESFLVGEEPAINTIDTTESLAIEPTILDIAKESIQPGSSPASLPPPAPAPEARAPQAKKSKTKLLRNLSMALALCLGVTFAFNLYNGGKDITYGGDGGDISNPNHEQQPTVVSIQNTWQVTKVELMQDGQAYNAIDYVPSFAEIIGAYYQFQNDGQMLITLPNGYTEYFPYFVADHLIQLGIEGYDKGEIDQLDNRNLVFTVPFTNETGTYYLRYSLVK